jgi:predicted MarR family transcription regulator
VSLRFGFRVVTSANKRWLVRSLHKTKNKNQTKTSKKRTQCALNTTIRKQAQITLDLPVIKIRVAHLFSVLCSPNYVSLRFGFRVVISAYKRWLVRYTFHN